MKKTDMIKIKQHLSGLRGTQLRDIHRAGAGICTGFGGFVEVELPRRTKSNTFEMVKTQTSKYALHIQCSFRLICKDRIIMAANDIFQPKEKEGNDPDFDWDTFDYDISGNNHFDEIVEEKLKPYFSEFIVEDIIVSRFGDLKIKFTNEYYLEIRVDSSLETECWRFFVSDANEKHLVITGTGIEYQ